jgi:hypothetical protein
LDPSSGYWGGGGLRRSHHEANHSPPSCTEVKKVEIYLHSTLRLGHAVATSWTNVGSIPDEVIGFFN